MIDTSYENKIFSIEPGEKCRPVSPVNDTFPEKLSHPIYFQQESLTFKQSPLKICHQLNVSIIDCLITLRIFHLIQYLLFSHSVIQSINLNRQINNAIRKVPSNKLTAATSLIVILMKK